MKILKLVLIFTLACLAPGLASAQDVQRGKAVFDLWCGSCHKPLGPYVSSVAGTSVLQRKYKGAKPAALEERTDLDAATVKFYVRHGVKFMPYFRKTEISDADLDALAAYLGPKPKR
jgi:mono/diheme cytochrome c family protein